MQRICTRSVVSMSVMV